MENSYTEMENNNIEEQNMFTMNVVVPQYIEELKMYIDIFKERIEFLEDTISDLHSISSPEEFECIREVTETIIVELCEDKNDK
jgi:hypothetical protein